MSRFDVWEMCVISLCMHGQCMSCFDVRSMHLGMHGECMSCVWVCMENVCHASGCAWRMSCVWICMDNVCHVFGRAWRMDVMCLGVRGDCVFLYIFQTTECVSVYIPDYIDC